jgi:hypothetical protein
MGANVYISKKMHCANIYSISREQAVDTFFYSCSSDDIYPFDLTGNIPSRVGSEIFTKTQPFINRRPYVNLRNKCPFHEHASPQK